MKKSGFGFSRRRIMHASVMGGLVVAGGATVKVFAQSTPLRRDVATIRNRGLDDLAKYAEGVQRLRNIPAGALGDAWLANADQHRVYCSRATSGVNQEIHGTWWFLPWHRAYLASTEMNIRAVLNDPGFALPYWHWPLTPSVPDAFRTGPLNHTRYGTGVVPPYAMDLSGLSRSTYRGQVSASGDLVDRGLGGWGAEAIGLYRSSLEGVPHGPIHSVVGGSTGSPPSQQFGDMAVLNRAARDPIFFAHHGNLDRLWEAWRSPAPSVHADSEPWAEPTFERSFPFFDVAGPPRIIKASATRTTEGLGYAYLPPGVPPAPPSAVTLATRIPEPPASALGPSTNRSGALRVRQDGAAPPGAVPGALPANKRAFLTLTGLTIPEGGVNAAVYLQPPGLGALVRERAGYVGLLSVLGVSTTAFKGDFALEATDIARTLGTLRLEAFLAPITELGGSGPFSLESYDLRVVS